MSASKNRSKQLICFLLIGAANAGLQRDRERGASLSVFDPAIHPHDYHDDGTYCICHSATFLNVGTYYLEFSPI